MKLMTRGLVVAALVCGVTIVQPETASANKCSAGKVKCVVNKTKALLGCHGKAAGKGSTVDAVCVQKAKAKFEGGTKPGCFEKLEAKGEKAGAKPDAVCPTSNDTAALEAKVDAFVADLVADLDTAAAANKCVAGKTKCAATKTGGAPWLPGQGPRQGHRGRRCVPCESEEQVRWRRRAGEGVLRETRSQG